MIRLCIMPSCQNHVTTYGRIVCDKCYSEGAQALQDHIKRQPAAPMPYYPRD
jgi:hypothetical protein